MLQATNGNLFRSDPNNGTSNRGPVKRRRPGTGFSSKYKKYMDMPLTLVQKKQVLAMAKRNEARSTEVKYNDTYAYNVVAASTWGLQNCTAIAQNITDLGRIGDEVMLRNIELKYRVSLNVGAPSNSNEVMRVVVAQCYSDNSLSTIVGTNFFQLGSTASQQNYLSAYNHDQRRLYKILYDETIVLCQGGPTAEARTVLLRPGRSKLRLDGATASGEGHIYLLYIADNSTSGTQPSLDYYMRVNYTDA